MEKEIYIKITKDGPYLVYGINRFLQKFVVEDIEKDEFFYHSGRVFEMNVVPVSLCRCGKSKNAPFCDNTHSYINFDGQETADFSFFMDNAVLFQGKNLKLYDNEKLCALVKFCDFKGSVWNLITVGTESADRDAVRLANSCPSGRLIIFDNGGNPLEEELPKTISLLEDEGVKISGPIYVSGGIRVESFDGRSYEIRNRQTLCRCGGSKNKPFCDCSHFYIKFQAGYPT